MWLIAGLLRHVFQHGKTGERMYVYRVGGGAVFGLVFGGEAHKARRVPFGALANEWRDLGEQAPRVVVALAFDEGEVDDCGDDECPIHGTQADKRKAPRGKAQLTWIGSTALRGPGPSRFACWRSVCIS